MLSLVRAGTDEVRAKNQICIINLFLMSRLTELVFKCIHYNPSAKQADSLSSTTAHCSLFFVYEALHRRNTHTQQMHHLLCQTNCTFTTSAFNFQALTYFGKLQFSQVISSIDYPRTKTGHNPIK